MSTSSDFLTQTECGRKSASRTETRLMMDKHELLQSLPKLAGRPVVIVGDMFLDEYITGRATRLSREVPIPVLEFAGRRFEERTAERLLTALKSEAYVKGGDLAIENLPAGRIPAPGAQPLDDGYHRDHPGSL